MNIQIDTREHAKEVGRIVAYFDRHGIEHFSSKLWVGDYMSLDNPRLVIDRKKNLAELCSNVSSVPKKNKDGTIKKTGYGRPLTELIRFTNELERAKAHGIKVVILCEHGQGFKTLEDVMKWQNPRLKDSPLAISGQRLYVILSQIFKKYDVDFCFCEKRSTGRRIAEILSANNVHE